MATRECPFCGKKVYYRLTQCSYCRETLPVVRSGDHSSELGGSQIREGLLAMLLAAILGYFAGGYSAMPLPFPIKPIVSLYLSPLLFLSGAGLSLRGYYLQQKAAFHARFRSRSV